MKITFKDVGHGDTIVLEWQSQGISNIGIIDCNEREGLNPCIDYLSTSHHTSISFFILSHPHEDHFSGLVEFLEFCEKNSIIIECFYHTFLPMLFGVMLKYDSKSDQINILNTYEKVDNLYKKGIIKAVKNIDSNSKDIILNGEFKIEILHPDYDSSKRLIDIDKKYQINNRQTKPNLNEIATILSVSEKDSYFLLTSDAPKKSFGNLLNYNKVLKGGQASHHGSKYNLHKKFWSKVSRDPTPPIYISVGESQWNLPDHDTIDFYKSNNYIIESTNLVGGLINSTKDRSAAKKKSNFLNNFSVLKSHVNSPRQKGKDLVFTY